MSTLTGTERHISVRMSTGGLIRAETIGIEDFRIGKYLRREREREWEVEASASQLVSL